MGSKILLIFVLFCVLQEDYSFKVCGGERFTCKNGDCIDSKDRCDGYADCRMGEDELNCNQVESNTCNPKQFQCFSGGCIAKSFFCDGDYDCHDGSDEPSTCPNRNCETWQFQCENKRCIDKLWACDGDKDCQDGSDEVNCTAIQFIIPPLIRVAGNCRDTAMFECSNGNCLPFWWRCDGHDDCDDGEDEKNCDVLQHHACSSDEFHCYLDSYHECVPLSSKCDCKFDCKYGEDEENCQQSCSGNFFKCPEEMRFIAKTQVCDGLPDCLNGADELSSLCPSIKLTTAAASAISQGIRCTTEQFQCANGQCIPSSLRCDGMRHCDDSSDEGSACERSCHKNNGDCPQICIPGLNGQTTCECEPGYTPIDSGKTCEDVDECQHQHQLSSSFSCSQFCNNTQGSYRCFCSAGYKLEPNGHVCKAIDRTAGNLIVSTGQSVESLSNYRHLAHSSNDPIKAIAYLSKTSTLYWVTVVSIYQQADGKVKSLIYKLPPSLNATALALDRVTGNVYISAIVAEEERSVIKVISSRNNKDYSAVTIVSTPTSITDLAIDNSVGLLFWSEHLQPHHLSGRIIRSTLDGSSIQWLYKVTRITHPVALTLDSIKCRIYWADLSLESISSCDYNGHGQKLIVSSTDGRPSSITFFENRISWANLDENIIHSRELGSETTSTQVLPEKIRHILSVHPILEEPLLPNPCSSSSSSSSSCGICLLRDRSTFVCQFDSSSQTTKITLSILFSCFIIVTLIM